MLDRIFRVWYNGGARWLSVTILMESYMSYAAIMAGVGAKYRSYTQRVHTKFQKNGLSDPDSAVEVSSRRRSIRKDGSVVLTYTFEDGKQVKVTYQDM